jgi:IclR family transcriptional regulator, KDG regulon repressor
MLYLYPIGEQWFTFGNFNGDDMSRSVQSLERGLMVMEALVRNGATGVTDLATELDLDKTVVHRLLYTLQSMDYVKQDANRKYSIGPKLLRIGAKTLATLDLRSVAAPYMQQLADHTNGVAHLAKWVESRAIYIERVQHPALRVNSTDVGGQAPGYCSAAGKVLWAYLPQLELNEVLNNTDFRSHTANTITDRFALQRHLAQVRDQGYALDNEEHRLGLIGIGVPVLDHTGTVIASICVAELSNRSDEKTRAETLEFVLKAAQNLSSDLGYSSSGF